MDLERILALPDGEFQVPTFRTGDVWLCRQFFFRIILFASFKSSIVVDLFIKSD